MLFRVAVAIIKMNHAEILACDSAASLYALMRAMTTHLYQVDKLLKVSSHNASGARRALPTLTPDISRSHVRIFAPSSRIATSPSCAMST